MKRKIIDLYSNTNMMTFSVAELATAVYIDKYIVNDVLTDSGKFVKE